MKISSSHAQRSAHGACHHTAAPSRNSRKRVAKASRQASLPMHGRAAETESSAPKIRTGKLAAPRQAVLGARKVAGGVEVVPHQENGKRCTEAEIQAAVQGLKTLPAADLKTLAEHGIRIHLFPVDGLEDGLLGATTVVQQDETSPWVPTKIRVAVRANLPGAQQTSEIVQHEVGHAIAVIKKQDRSEDAAIAYAKKY